MDYASCCSSAGDVLRRGGAAGRTPRSCGAKHGGKYAPLSWAETVQTVSRLARGLIALGVEPGDRVALVSENRPEWAIADLAIMSAGAITVPAYVTNTGRRPSPHLRQ